MLHSIHCLLKYALFIEYVYLPEMFLGLMYRWFLLRMVKVYPVFVYAATDSVHNAFGSVPESMQ